MNLMLLNPDKKYYLAEIAKILGKEPSAYQKHVENFIQDGLFSNERIGNMRFFWLNKNYQFYNEIKSIISKTIGIEAQLKILLKEIDSVEIAFIFGSFATDKFNSNSDIDLFIIGEEKENTIIEPITKFETEINRSINYHIYSKDEVFDKINIENDFINNIFSRKIILLKGSIDEYKKSN